MSKKREKLLNITLVMISLKTLNPMSAGDDYFPVTDRKHAK